MHNIIILDCRKNSSLTFTKKLREQFKGSHDLIIHHEWINDFLRAKLSKEQFNRLISQQAFCHDWLTSKIISLTLKDPTKPYDELRKIANFLLNESFGDLRLLDNTYTRSFKLSAHTKEYIENLENIWLKHTYINKLISLFPILWIHSDLGKLLLNDESHFITSKEWLNKITLSHSQKLLEVLCRLIDDEAQFISSQEQLELENILSRLYQFELLIRNEAYQINFNQVQQFNNHKERPS
jgi:thiaminase